MQKLAKNLHYLRKSRSLTQEQIAGLLGLTRGKWESYEKGRAKPPLDTLAGMASYFGLSLDHLVYTLLAETDMIAEGDIEILGEPALPDEDAPSAAVPEGMKAIEIVSQLVQAGYLAGYQDAEYVKDLPQLYLPKQMLGPGTFRAFQITGYSMLPLQPGTIVIGRETHPDYITGAGKQAYILVTREDGIVFKRVWENQSKHLVLRSDNPDPQYADYSIEKDHILEAWEARMYISTNLP